MTSKIENGSSVVRLSSRDWTAILISVVTLIGGRTIYDWNVEQARRAEQAGIANRLEMRFDKMSDRLDAWNMRQDNERRLLEDRVRKIEQRKPGSN